MFPLASPGHLSPARIAFAVFLVFATAGGSHAAVSPGEFLISELNCAACHDAASATARLASRPSPRLDATHAVLATPQWLHDFLLHPQAEKPETLMPDMLAGLDGSQRSDIVDALTHFLVSVRPSGKDQPVGFNEATVNAGRALYHSVGCVQCHAPEDPPPGQPADKVDLAAISKTAVPLGHLAKKYTVAALADFLADPLSSRPGGRMPSLKLTKDEARAISMYLLRTQAPAGEASRLAGLNYDYYEKQLPELPVFDRLTPKTSGNVPTFSLSVAERKNDYALQFKGVLSVPKPGEYEFFTKSDDGSRLYLDQKLIVENGGIHPAQERSGKVKLSAGAHAILVVYFDGGGQTALKVSWQGPDLPKQEIPAATLSHEGRAMRPEGDAAFVVDQKKAAAGANYYESLQCSRCHGALKGRSPVDAAPPAARPLARLNGRQPAGCLSAKPHQGIPYFEITDRQRAVILAQLGTQSILAEPLTPEQQIVRTMTVLNCYACHNRDRRGGPEGIRREYFTSIGEVDLGDEGKFPPSLGGVGAKLRPEWIKTVLVEGGAVRPYMATRMPQFGAANVGALPELFDRADARADALPQPDVFAPGVAADANKYGRKLLGVGGLTCIACHMFAGNKSLGAPALDLATAGQRLKFDWFHRYLLDPQSLRPGTRMPPFWPNGVATNREILDGDTEKQISAIWGFLARKNFTDLPPGLIQGKMELVPDKEAIIYRNFIEGAGSRAIGVGYPEKANIAFDANEMRLALLWQGAFIDAARHRTGRGEGFEKPLGTDVIAGPPGPAFAVLESESAGWPTATGRTAGWQFRGYTLDAERRPAFRYQWHDLSFEDYPMAIAGKNDASLLRTITIHSGKPLLGLFFRAAVADKIQEKDGTFVVGETERLKFTGIKPFIRQSDGKSELLAPIDLSRGATTFTEEITW